MSLRRPLALASLFLLASLLPLFAQSGSSDTVKYRDRSKGGTEESKFGEVKETTAGIVLTVGGKAINISPADIIAVYYGSLPGVDDSARQGLIAVDTKGGVEARTRYEELLKTASTSGSNDRTRRFLEFKQAMWAAKVADSKSGQEFRTEAATAIAALTSVARSYNKSWEVWPASRTAARLQAEIGKYNEAAQTLNTLAKTEGLPVELQNEARLAEVDVLFRSGSAIAAEPVIAAVAKATNLSASQKERVAVYQAALTGAKEKTDTVKVQAAAKSVRDLMDKMTDPAGKAAAHNALGELYLMANLPRDAMWEFLWVEAVHNSDRDEVTKALERLADLFDKQGDKERAAVYREKLVKAKGA